MNALLKQLKDVHKRKIVVIRHGQTLLNKEGRIRGWMEVPLDAVGFQQAEDLGKELKDGDIDMLVVSDLTRTLQTAHIISLESGIPIVATTRTLRPLDVGKYTGEKNEKVVPLVIKSAVEEPDEPVGGGESFDTFRYRVLMGVISYLNEFPDKLIGFVAHHRNERLLKGWVEAGCPDDFSIDMEHFGQKGIEPGTFDVLELESPLLK